MLDRLTGITVFIKAATTGSISRAARQMELSAAMATKHLDALEARIGVKLLHRTTRKLTLTDAGRRYLEACSRILPELEEAEAAVGAERKDASGVLRLSAPLSFGVRYIAPLMAPFAAEHPNVTVELGLNDRRIDLIEEGWDMTVRIGTLDESRLVARKIADAAVVLCAAPAYWRKHGKPTQAAELSLHNCLRYSLSAHATRNVWAFGRQREILIPVSGNLRANNGDALVKAAIEGQGVICEPEFIVADAVRAGQLEVAVLEEPFGQLDGIHIVYPPQRHLPKRSRAMIDFLAARFGPVPPWRL